MITPTQSSILAGNWTLRYIVRPAGVSLLRFGPVLILVSFLAACSSTPQLADPSDVGVADGGSDAGLSSDVSAPDVPAPDVSASDVDAGSNSDVSDDSSVAPDARADLVDWPEDAVPACPQLSPIAPPAALGLDPFYTRYVDSGGIAIVGSDGVPAEAFARAHYVIANMLQDQPCARAAIVDSGIRVAILSRDEVTSDIPEYSDFYDAFPGVDWDTRGRGFGATLVRPVTSGSVDNLLEDSTDPWVGENILLHEMAHSYWEFGVRDLLGGIAMDARLDAAYEEASATGLWADTYALTNPAEYWAEGVQTWFNNNATADPPNGIHNWVDSRSELAEYDPVLFDLISELFSPDPWPAYCAEEGPAWLDPTPVLTPSDCEFEMRTLRNLGCERLDGESGSGASDDASEMVFVNRSFDRTLQVSWVDYDGGLVEYGSLEPRGLVHQATFVGHPWVVTDGEQCVGYYLPETARTRVVFE
jgi:hypothetical protein